MNDSSPTVSRWLSWLAAGLRAAGAFPGCERLLRAAGRSARGRTARASIGRYQLRFDVRDPFQAQMALGRYEPDTAALIRRMLRPGDAYLDVGAQLGYFAAVAGSVLGSRGTMLLFEPDPRAYVRLRETIESAEGDGSPRAIVFQAACSDEVGEVEFHISDMLGRSSLVGFETPSGENPTLRIPATRLDDTLESESINHVRLIKMDVEGHEVEALRGLTRTLESGRVDYLIVEKNQFFEPLTGYGAGHLHSAMASRGYIGAHEDGRAVTRDSLEVERLENLVYARTEELMRDAFPGFAPAEADASFATKDLAPLAEEAARPDHPSVEARRIVQRARTGELESAVSEALGLVGRNPEMNHLRGHLAHWLGALGRRAEAIDQYRLVLEADPEDQEAGEALNQLTRDADA